MISRERHLLEQLEASERRAAQLEKALGFYAADHDDAGAIARAALDAADALAGAMGARAPDATRFRLTAWLWLTRRKAHGAREDIAQ